MRSGRRRRADRSRTSSPPPTWASRTAIRVSFASASASLPSPAVAATTRSRRTSAASGSDASASAGTMTGNTCAEHLAEVGRRLDEPGEDLVRGRRLVEPERPQQLDRRLPVPAGSRRRGAGERLEQRPVEEALVDLPDQRGLPLELGEQLVLAARAERAREDGSGGGVRGELVRLEVAHDLQTVLERPQESVRAGRARPRRRVPRTPRRRGSRARAACSARAGARPGGRGRSAGAGPRTPRRGSRRDPA